MILSENKRACIRSFALFIIISSIIFSPIKKTNAQTDKELADLWLDMSIGLPIVPIFNSVARSDDIARVGHPSQIAQLDGISNGRKLIIFKSIAETEEYLPDIAAEIDIIGYNLEHSPATPPEEQQDPVGSIQEMREYADTYGLLLAFGPDHDFALSHGVQIAPYVDIFVLQIQQQQTNPEVVREFVEPLVPLLREANPDIQISVQVRTEGDVQAIVALLNSLIEYLDGISILTSPDTVDIAQALVSALRPAPTAITQTQALSAHPLGLPQNPLLITITLLALIAQISVMLYRRFSPPAVQSPPPK